MNKNTKVNTAHCTTITLDVKVNKTLFNIQVLSNVR